MICFNCSEPGRNKCVKHEIDNVLSSDLQNIHINNTRADFQMALTVLQHQLICSSLLPTVVRVYIHIYCNSLTFPTVSLRLFRKI